MNKQRYLFIDTETGGLDLDSSLLTLSIVVANNELEIIDELDLQLKPADGNYSINITGLKVNKINLINHDGAAIPYEDAAKTVKALLKRHYEADKIKLTMVGHNPLFDQGFINKYLVPKDTWHQYVSYRLVDTAGLAQFFKIKGKIPSNVSGSLSSLASFFNIDTSLAHTSMGDSLMCLEVLKKMKSL